MAILEMQTFEKSEIPCRVFDICLRHTEGDIQKPYEFLVYFDTFEMESNLKKQFCTWSQSPSRTRQRAWKQQGPFCKFFVFFF